MVPPTPQDPPRCTPDQHGQTGAGGRGQKCVLALSAHVPVLVLQPWPNQLWERGAGLVPPENMTPAECPVVASEKRACAVSWANAAVVTAKDCWLSEAPQEGLSPNMFFTLSAASKAQVCQIYFPCKLFLHN